MRPTLIWLGLAIALVVPVALAAMSPQLAWREPVYIIAGFAGVLAMAALLIQPLLAGGLLPGLTPATARRLHRATGASLLALVLVHVITLWFTSPPDVIDALLLVSPTPFSLWGVIAMWAIFATALLALLRRRLRRPLWRWGHRGLAVIIIAGSVAHALLIEGTMEVISKWALCALVVLAALRTLSRKRVWH